MMAQLSSNQGTKEVVRGPATKIKHLWRPGLSLYFRASMVMVAVLLAMAI